MVEDETPRLLRALALSQRFHLYIARSASPRAADELVERIETELPKLRGAQVHVARLEPYAERATDAPLSHELLTTILVPLLDPPQDLRRHGTVHIVDASRATASDDDAWARLFASWNEKRNRLQQLGGEVVVVLPRALSLVFATDAPDVWSIRSGEYEIAEHSERSASAAARGADLPVSRAMDIGSARRAVPVSRELPTWRLVPPLSLFGGDVVIADWLRDVLQVNETRSITAPSTSGSAQSQIRLAELALGDRDFAHARRILAVLADTVTGDAVPEVRVQIALALTLAAQDEPAAAWSHIARAQTRSSDATYRWRLPIRVSVLGAAAHVAWCLGELARTAGFVDELAAENGRSHPGPDLLRAMESGHMARARALAAELAPPAPVRRVEERRRDSRRLAERMVAADFAYIADDVAAVRLDLESAVARTGDRTVATALRDVEDAVARSADPDSVAGSALLPRARPLAALLAAAQGDINGAERVLRGGSPLPELAAGPPDAAARMAAFEAYAAGAVASARGHRRVARERFEASQREIDRWAAVGFDRRSLARARVAVLVAACAVDGDPERARATATEAADRAMVLLGSTGEDCIARVLAVEARWACARTAIDRSSAHQFAREAVELAQPLRAAGIESWTALADRRIDDLEAAPAAEDG